MPSQRRRFVAVALPYASAAEFICYKGYARNLLLVGVGIANLA
jgi:hypothetical protein